MSDAHKNRIFQTTISKVVSIFHHCHKSTANPNQLHQLQNWVCMRASTTKMSKPCFSKIAIWGQKTRIDPSSVAAVIKGGLDQ